jgi:hypothetical protein
MLPILKKPLDEMPPLISRRVWATLDARVRRPSLDAQLTFAGNRVWWAAALPLVREGGGTFENR